MMVVYRSLEIAMVHTTNRPEIVCLFFTCTYFWRRQRFELGLGHWFGLKLTFGVMGSLSTVGLGSGSLGEKFGCRFGGGYGSADKMFWFQWFNSSCVESTRLRRGRRSDRTYTFGGLNCKESRVPPGQGCMCGILVSWGSLYWRFRLARGSLGGADCATIYCD